MLERDIEKYLCKKVKELGGIPYKFTSPSRRSVPDRLCVFPTGFIVFVEVKATNGKVTKLQAQEHKRLRELGCLVKIVYSNDDVWDFYHTVKKAIIT